MPIDTQELQELFYEARRQALAFSELAKIMSAAGNKELSFECAVMSIRWSVHRIHLEKKISEIASQN